VADRSEKKDLADATLPATDRFTPILRWRVAVAQPAEAARWDCMDGRWVSITVGDGDDIGSVLVRSSDGALEKVDTYEGALELARAWRT
jgi:hypothetical protein